MLFKAETLKTLSTNFLPFADAASDGLPLGQLLRLSLFQVSVGMASVMLLGTLNRVMIVELNIAAMLVAVMIAIPVLVAPFRALVGFKSDTYRSAIGWKRIPYLWFGTMWQFGGLAIMPMALLVLSGDRAIDADWAGYLGAGLAFLLTGIGMHMTQTAGLALAADRATDETRPKVVALLYVMFLVGMAVSAIIIGALLRDYSGLRLVQVVQGTAVVTLLLNITALWKQEKVAPMTKAERTAPRPFFKDAWNDLVKGGDAGRWLKRGMSTFRMAANGILAGVAAFSLVIFAAPLDSIFIFYTGAILIGFGGGLFGVSTLTAAMTMPTIGSAGRGLALGAWGAAQATGAGLSIFIGGTLRDLVNHAAGNGTLGEALATPATGYSVVYHTEIGLLFITLIVLGPLVKVRAMTSEKSAKLELADFPT